MAAIASGLVALAHPALAHPALAHPALAGQHVTTGTLSSWAYTDSVSPFKTFLDAPGDLPVGAWRDPIDKLHSSKAYFTFSLPPLLRRARIFAAEVNVRETAANDCTKPRSAELWLTDTNERPTWQYPPRERLKLPGPGNQTACGGVFLGWSAGDAVRQAVAAGQSKITLALRMPAGQQRDPAFGRRYANNPMLLITYNLPPNVPTGLTFANKPCAADQFVPQLFQPRMAATVTDPDSGARIAGEFALWPVDAPDQRFERTSLAGFEGGQVSVGVPEGVFVDNRTYEWTVRAFDGDDFSAFAPSCQFTTDFVRPTEPNVSSVDYPDDGLPHGGSGLPGRFTFTANGVPDVAGFRYGPSQSTTEFVAAETLGGSATVMIAPTFSGRNDLFVSSVDRAGNISPQRWYQYRVQTTEPFVTLLDPPPGYGVPTDVQVTPRMADVVSYTWTMNGGPETTVPAASGGVTVISVVPPIFGLNHLDVWSTTSTGIRSGANRFRIITINAPRVHSDDYPEHGSAGGPGVPGQFTFRPRQPNVVEYQYTVDFGDEVTVPAEPDGTATITYTPTEPGDHILTVSSRSATEEFRSESTDYFFEVNPDQ